MAERASSDRKKRKRQQNYSISHNKDQIMHDIYIYIYIRAQTKPGSYFCYRTNKYQKNVPKLLLIFWWHDSVIVFFFKKRHIRRLHSNANALLQDFSTLESVFKKILFQSTDNAVAVWTRGQNNEKKPVAVWTGPSSSYASKRVIFWSHKTLTNFATWFEVILIS